MKHYLCIFLFFCMVGCETDSESGSEIVCGAGTTLNYQTCEPNLSAGLSLDDTGQVVVDTSGEEYAAVLAAARAEGKAEGLAEGTASVTPLSCAEGTAENEAGDACEPTPEYRAAAVEEGRLAGVASVTPLSCAEGTAENEAGDACEPTPEYRAAAVEEGRLAGVASVTPLNCAEGTAENEAGDACIPRLSDDVEVTNAGLIEPTEEFRAEIFGAGADSREVAVVEGASGDCPLIMHDYFGVAPHEIQRAICPAGTYPTSLICTAERQVSACTLKECIPDESGRCDMTCEAADLVCYGKGRQVNLTCNASICEDSFFADTSEIVCNENATCTAIADSSSTTCNAGAACSSRAGTGDDVARQTCREGSNCECHASTGDAQCIVSCERGAQCTASTSTGDARATMTCAPGSNCRCSTSVGNSSCTINCAEGADCVCDGARCVIE